MPPGGGAVSAEPQPGPDGPDGPEAASDAAVDDLAGDLVAFRRDLHQHPELSWQEHRTSARLVERLRSAGLDPRPALPPDGVGVVCDVAVPAADGTPAPDEGPPIVLRADIDALPMPDRKEVPYRSTHDGACHACGHDVHTAVVLGAGLALHRAGAGCGGRVRLLFQPAEETLPSGARALHEAGAAVGARAVLAVHCAPALDVGTVGLRAGPITSAADLFRITLRGPGGHTGRPHQTADLVHVAGRVICDLPASLHRLTDSRDGLNLTFGAVNAGRAPNVIPTEAVLQGTLRTLGRTTWERAPDLVASLVAGIVEPLGATAEVDYRVGSPPVENDPDLTALVAGVAADLLGAEAVLPTEQSGGGEDFSWFQGDGPCCYVRLGVRRPGGPFVDIHHETFDVDEACIPVGARLLARTVGALLDR